MKNINNATSLSDWLFGKGGDPAAETQARNADAVAEGRAPSPSWSVSTAAQNADGETVVYRDYHVSPDETWVVTKAREQEARYGNNGTTSIQRRERDWVESGGSVEPGTEYVDYSRRSLDEYEEGA
jgi:hypothetical protein